ncbi:unnamed protein product, partial [Oppiella nova]
MDIIDNVQFNNSSPMGEYAVIVNNIYFGYREPHKVLNDFSVQIAKGQIFALLGSNGSGKTTLLKLICGRLGPHSGHIYVYGCRPGSKKSEIPGSAVGYMPQELALYDNFTIQQTLTYYAMIYGMSGQALSARTVELSLMLRLPELDKRVDRLSGGQRRLVSLSAALIYSPKLLILDEPTVGVDPLLRHQIWMYLQQLCRENATTVIISTHYMEEAKNAGAVCFIRNGRRVAYGSPEKLLALHLCHTLEEVYYNSCIQSKPDNSVFPNEFVINNHKAKDQVLDGKGVFAWNHMKALVFRDIIDIRTKALGVLLYFLVPVITIFLIHMTFQEPRNIAIAIVNGDSQSASLSTQFIDQLDSQLFVKTYYEANGTAYESVVSGQNVLSIVLDQDFDDSIRQLMVRPLWVTDNQVMDSATIKLYIEMTNPIVTQFAIYYLIRAYQTFAMNYSSFIGHNPGAYSSPINVIDDKALPVLDPNTIFSGYILPGTILIMNQVTTMIFTMAFVFSFYYERLYGTFDRNFVAGVTPLAILTTRSAVGMVYIVIQALFMAGATFYVFGYPCDGRLFDCVLLIVLNGVQYMCFGTTIAIILNSRSACVLLCSGMLWPLESLPPLMQWGLQFIPITSATTTMNLILAKGNMQMAT